MAGCTTLDKPRVGIRRVSRCRSAGVGPASLLNLPNSVLPAGTIPQLLSNLTCLTWLDLSNNHLRGEFVGNPGHVGPCVGSALRFDVK